jgi:hypothetical protein
MPNRRQELLHDRIAQAKLGALQMHRLATEAFLKKLQPGAILRDSAQIEDRHGFGLEPPGDLVQQQRGRSAFHAFWGCAGCEEVRAFFRKKHHTRRDYPSV